VDDGIVLDDAATHTKSAAEGGGVAGDEVISDFSMTINEAASPVAGDDVIADYGLVASIYPCPIVTNDVVLDYAVA
jgi:hypothetical protein